MKEYLEAIVRNDGKGIYHTILVTNEPLRLINQLREAKSYLSKMDHSSYNNHYIHLATICNYAFRVDVSSHPAKVIARLRVPKAVEEEVPIFHPVESHTNPEITDVLAAISYVIMHKNIERIVFPALPMESSEITPLFNWCEKNKYAVSISEEGVVLKKA